MTGQMSKDDFDKILADFKDKLDAQGIASLINAFSNKWKNFELSEDQFDSILGKVKTGNQSEQDMAKLIDALFKATNSSSVELTPELFYQIFQKTSSYQEDKLANEIKNLLENLRSLLDSDLKLSDNFLGDILKKYVDDPDRTTQVKIELIGAIQDFAKKYESESELKKTIGEILENMSEKDVSKSDSDNIDNIDSSLFQYHVIKKYRDNKEVCEDAKSLLKTCVDGDGDLNLNGLAESLEQLRNKKGTAALRIQDYNNFNYFNKLVELVNFKLKTDSFSVDELYKLMEEVFMLQGTGRAKASEVYYILDSVSKEKINIRNTVKLIQVLANLGTHYSRIALRPSFKYKYIPLTDDVVDLLLNFCNTKTMDELFGLLPKSDSLAQEAVKKEHATEDIRELVNMLLNLKRHACGCSDLNVKVYEDSNVTFSDKAKEASDKIKLTNEQVNNLLSLYCEVPHNLKEIEALIENLKELKKDEFELSGDTTKKVLNSIYGKYSKTEIVKFVKSLNKPIGLEFYNKIRSGTQIMISDLESTKINKINMESLDKLTEFGIVLDKEFCQEILDESNEFVGDSYIRKMDLIAKLKSNNPDFNPTMNVLSGVVVTILSIFTYFRNLLGNVKNEEIDRVVSQIGSMTGTMSPEHKSSLEVITNMIKSHKGEDFQNALQQKLKEEKIDFKEFSDQEMDYIIGILSKKLTQDQLAQVLQFGKAVSGQDNNKKENNIIPIMQEDNITPKPTAIEVK